MRVATRVKTRSRRTRWGARLLGAGLATAAAVGISAGPAAAAAVPPIFVADNPTEKGSCPDRSNAIRVSPSTNPQTIPVTIPNDGTGSVTVTFSDNVGDGPRRVSFTTTGTIAVSQVTVKGGDDANRYLYNAVTGFPNGIAFDTGLISPLNNGGQLPAVSHADFCFTPSNYGGGTT
ncbi:hypothetical protein [Streptomyces sp. R41]|uniref:Uncharacterized protein n=1 Tax=Streptomyces sp. R41 TaxID=3238632 RepID=A0AB39RP32_9ACTN